MLLINRRNIGLGLGLMALGVLLYIVTPQDTSCRPITTQVATEGSQGYRVWSGDTLRTFEHGTRTTCVPSGWEAVGALKAGEGWAQFEPNKTGVIIRSDAWTKQTIKPQHTSYTVQVLYAKSTTAKDVATYTALIEHSFSSVGLLFRDTGSSRSHTVLITAGLAGDTIAEHTRVYPDPTERLSVIVRTPQQERTEELLNHAVVHLYNRFRTDLIGYESLQAPFSADDWQEVEATWAETALSMSKVGSSNRVSYLYSVHKAVRAGTNAGITSPPFNDPELFANITQSAVLAQGADEIDAQYGHYILAPLMLLATEGLLRTYHAPVDVRDLLVRIHTGQLSNFMQAVGTYIPRDAARSIEAWIHGSETVPYDLVERGLTYYQSKGL